MFKKELPFRWSARSLLVIVVILLAIALMPWSKIDAGPQTLVDQFGLAVLGNDEATVSTLLVPADVEVPKAAMQQRNGDIESFITYLKENPKELDQFVQASVNEDWNTVSGMYQPGEVPSQSFKLESGDLKGLVEFWHNHPQELTSLIDILKNQIKLLENGQEQVAYLKQFDVNIEKSGKSWLFFDKYSLAVKPYWISVNANFPNTKLYLNDQEIGQLKRSGTALVFGPFAPGKYTLKAVVENGDKPVIYSQHLTLINDQRQIVPIDLAIPAGDVKIKSNYINAKVELNGKDLGTFIGSGLKLGPLALDGSTKIQLSRQFPWGEMKSEAVVLKSSGETYIPIQPGKSDDVQTRLIATIGLYNKSWVNAFTSLDASKLSKTSDRKINELSKQIDRAKLAKQSYKGKLLKIDFDLDSFQVYMTDKNYVQYLANVDVVETYNDVVNVSKTPLRYTLIYNNGEWQVDSSSPIEGLNSKDIRTIRFDK